MPDLMDELRAIAPSHEIPEWATKVAAGGRGESSQPTVVRDVDNLRRSERAPGARRRTAWTLGLAAVVALIALVAATVWWAPWQPKMATQRRRPPPCRRRLTRNRRPQRLVGRPVATSCSHRA